MKIVPIDAYTFFSYILEHNSQQGEDKDGKFTLLYHYELEELVNDNWKTVNRYYMIPKESKDFDIHETTYRKDTRFVSLVKFYKN